MNKSEVVMTTSVLTSCMKSLLIYPMMQEETAGLCHVVEATRHQQVFLLVARCPLFHIYVTGHRHLCFSSMAQTTKIPIRTFEYPGVVNSKLAWTLSFYLHGGNQSFKFFKYCKREIHDVGFCSLEFTRVDSLPTGGLWVPYQVVTAAVDWTRTMWQALSWALSYLISSDPQ